MVTILLAFALIVALGVGWRQLAPAGLPVETVRAAINALVFNLFLPALCLQVLARAALDRSAVLVPAAAWVTIAVALGLALLAYRIVGRMAHLTPPQTGVLIIAAAFGNVTYLGLPVLTGLYGTAAARFAIFYDLFAHTPLLWMVGVSLAARFGSGGRQSPGQALRTVAGLPPIWGCLAGIGLNLARVPLPAFVLQALGMMSALVVPLMIFSVGLALRWPHPRHAAAIAPALLIKLAVSPAVSFATARFFGLHGTALVACGLEGAMPTMVVTLLIADRFGLDTELGATCIVATTALTFLTLPGLVGLMQALAH